MIDFLENALLVVLFTFLGLSCLFLLVVFFVVLPVDLTTEQMCLEAGYPEHRVTWNLDRYCLNLDGDVTVKVEELK